MSITPNARLRTIKAWSVPSFAVPEPKPRTAVRVASILDEFSDSCFAYEAELFRLGKDNWQSQIERTRPHFLLVESAWRGNSGEWQYVLTNYGKSESNPLRRLLAYCKVQGIPTVFWNKEDPPNFDVFVDAAADFDIIFTTDVNCVPRYVARCGHTRVYCLPFAAQPAIHNPIGKSEYEALDIAFAGSWYGKKHAERAATMPYLLDAAMKHRLFIFDRMSDWTRDDSYKWPDKYQPFVHSRVSYTEMLNIHRMFKVVLNTNSVVNSPTMFSRRVYEVLASSTPVVSTQAVGPAATFGDLVPMVDTPDDAQCVLDGLLSDQWARKKLGHRGYRAVLSHHTMAHRFNDICRAVGITTQLENATPLVTVAVSTNRPDNIEIVKRNFLRQNYPNLEFIVVLNSDEFDIGTVRAMFAEMKNVNVMHLPESCTLGECLNSTVEESHGSFWTKMDDDNIYLEDFVSDLMIAFNYTNADVVGKATYFMYLEGSDRLVLRFVGREHQYVEFLSGRAMIMRRKVFDTIRFPETSIGEDTAIMKHLIASDRKMYSADCFNYVVVRKADVNRHTWKIQEEEIIKTCKIITNGCDLSRVRC